MFRSIVVGTDGSPTAERAVRQAAELAGALGSRVHVVSAYKPAGGAQLSSGESSPEMRAWDVRPDAEVSAILDHAAAVFRSAGVEVERHGPRGDAADALLSVAADCDADLVVVGNRGMSGTKRFLLGSVPNKVSHHAPCSVMIVNTAQ